VIRDVIDDTHLRRTRRYLDRHRPLQIGVGRAGDPAHAAGADLLSDFVDAEASARSEGQTAGTIAISVARTRSILCNADLVLHPGRRVGSYYDFLRVILRSAAC
jgi:hypothetical protein